jgi:hypothetical protein
MVRQDSQGWEQRNLYDTVKVGYFSVWCQVDGDLIWNQENTGSRPVALTKNNARLTREAEGTSFVSWLGSNPTP